MSIENFEILDKQPNSKSILKRGYKKVYPQQGANLNDPDQIIELIFGVYNIYHQIGNT